MKRRTKQAQMRAAAKRAGRPSGKSRYALKKIQQARGKCSLCSPFRITEVVEQEAA